MQLHFKSHHKDIIHPLSGSLPVSQYLVNVEPLLLKRFIVDFETEPAPSREAANVRLVDSSDDPANPIDPDPADPADPIDPDGTIG